MSPSVLASLLIASVSTVLADDPPAWGMHDRERPWPVHVDPGPLAGPVAAPSDAVVLFDGTNADAWTHRDGSGCKWTVTEDGALRIEKGTGELATRASFGDCQLHLEWMCPDDQGHRSDQNRGNSGVFLMSTYEVQVLSTHENRTYADGMGGAIYGQYPPAVNPCRPMGEWQTYDIVFTRPRFDAEGKLLSPAVITMFFNGVLVHDHAELIGPASHSTQRAYAAHADALPLSLQDHGEPVHYRNIWIRSLEE